MKILAIRFENLNALKGGHEIDFRKAPFSDAGLFAITGPTGAGKSTLLDAITLALFNEIPRLGDLSKEKMEEKNWLMTHGTRNCWAEVEYDAHGKTYRSKWSIARNRNNKLNEYEMEIAELPSGTILCSKKKEVRKLNEQLIGLTFEQFTKASLLSQGDFARFLKDKKQDQIRLLEHLSGTQEYRKIGQAAYSRNKQLKEEMDLLAASLEGFVVLSDEKVRQLHSEVKQHRLEELNLAPLLENTREKIRVREDLKKEQVLLGEKEKEMTEHIAAGQNLIPRHEELAAHEKAVAFRKEIERINDLRKELLRLNNDLHVKTEEQKRFEERMAEAIKEIEPIVPDEKNDLLLLNRIDDVLNNYRRLQNELGVENAILEESGKRKLQLFSAISTILQTALKNHARPVEHLSTLKATIEKELLAETYFRGKELSHLEQEKEVYVSLLVQTRECRIHQQNHQKNTERIVALKEEYNAVTQQRINCEKETPELNEAIRILSASIQNLRKQLEIEKAKAGLEQFRHLLIAGEACPLCGSKEHSSESHNISESGVGEQIRKEEEQLEKFKALQSEKQAEIRQLNDKADLLQKEIVRTEEQFLSEKKQLEELLSGIRDQSGLKETEIEELERQISRRESDLKKQIEHHKDLASINELLSILQKEQSSKTKLEELKEKMMIISRGADVEKLAGKIKPILIESRATIDRIKADREELKKALETGSAELHGLENDLNAKVISKGFKDIENCSSLILPENKAESIRQIINDFNSRKAALQSALSEVKQRVSTLEEKNDTEKNDEELQSEFRQLAEQLEQSKSLIVEKSTLLRRDQEDREQRTQKQQELDQKKQEIWKWDVLNKLIGDAEGTRLTAMVQEITLSSLIIYANRRLEKLAPRYMLRKAEGKGEDLRVEDRYMGNSSRDVKTLSGGETFLLSLALALGLSDLASRNVRIESLFIDEGFGTLDEESLDITLTTLEKLQSEDNKTIGVISHVDALKERITTQIRLFKSGNGISKMEIV